jgi:predicted PurR-regulated permease PerM
MLLQRVSFYVLLVLVTIAFVAVVLPFYSAIFWAVVLAIIFFPFHARLEARLGGRANLAAALSVLICLCVVIIPGLIVLSSLVQQGNLLYQRMDSGEIDVRSFIQKMQEALPLFLRDWLRKIELNGADTFQDRVSSALMQGGGFFAGRALSLGQNTLRFFVTFGVMLYLLFFVFRDGRALPVSSEERCLSATPIRCASLPNSPRSFTRPCEAILSSPSSRVRSAGSPSGHSASNQPFCGAC